MEYFEMNGNAETTNKPENQFMEGLVMEVSPWTEEELRGSDSSQNVDQIDINIDMPIGNDNLLDTPIIFETKLQVDNINNSNVETCFSPISEFNAIGSSTSFSESIPILEQISSDLNVVSRSKPMPRVKHANRKIVSDIIKKLKVFF
ncbi:hypothetical protein HK096_006787 [Nowakowskiella sp. JEL0078]|nr:hypothetical protein HK096_006787 [Nowakowskiella sp. JEL0078]